MNYYPFHIGDYALKTRHLSWSEDMAYRRMLDIYYSSERPLPVDPKAICRLVLATTDEQREAVNVVLAEFFVWSEEGWRHARCDEEIAGMKEKQAASDERAAHEAERMQRHREKRSEMFKALRSVGVTPAWDIPMADLQRAYNEHFGKPATPPKREQEETCNAPATHLQREQVVSCNGPATAIPTPTPTPTPTPNGGKPPHTPPQRDALPDWLDAEAWNAWRRHRRAMRKPLTAEAERLALRDLQRLSHEGHDPKAVIENAIVRGWQGLYPPKVDPPPRSARLSVSELNAGAFDEFLGRVGTVDDGRTVDA